MGFALPAAIGAKFAKPGSEVWVVVGDGGFQMTMSELVHVQEKISIKIAIINNGYLGMVRSGRSFSTTALRRYSLVARILPPLPMPSASAVNGSPSALKWCQSSAPRPIERTVLSTSASSRKIPFTPWWPRALPERHDSPGPTILVENSDRAIGEQKKHANTCRLCRKQTRSLNRVASLARRLAIILIAHGWSNRK